MEEGREFSEVLGGGDWSGLTERSVGREQVFSTLLCKGPVVRGAGRVWGKGTLEALRTRVVGSCLPRGKALGSTVCKGPGGHGDS